MERKKDRSIWILFGILVVVAAISVAMRLWQPKERIPWRGDLAAASAEARAENKPMLLYFTAEWCAPCQSLKHTTWADEKVETALSAYVPVKIDIDQHPDLAMRYRVEAVPHFVLVGPDEQLKNIASGAMSSSQFLEWLKG